MKRIVYLFTAALVAMLILVPTAMAQDTMMEVESATIVEDTVEQPLPKSGGAVTPSVLLPATALLLGSGVLAFAVLRRR